MKKLVYIRRHDTDYEWCDAASRQTGVGSADEVLSRHAGSHVVYLLPGTEVTLTTVQLPRQSPSKLRRVAPFVLEERLASNADNMHCGLGHVLEENRYPVAIVDRRHMQPLRALFEEHGIEAATVIADVHALPCPGTQEKWHILYEPDHVVVRTGEHSGFACEPELVGEYLQLMDRPEALDWRVWVSRDVREDEDQGSAFSAFMDACQIPETAVEPVSHALHALAHTRLPQGAISLLQGDYAIEPGYQRWLTPWKPAAALLGVWIVAGGVVQAMETQRAQTRLDQLEADAAAALQKAFPDVTRITNLRRQAEQKLRSRAGGGPSADFLLLLNEAGLAVQAISGMELQEVQYRNGELALSLSGPGVESLDQLKAHFATRQEASLKVESANAGAKGMSIRARLSRAGHGAD